MSARPTGDLAPDLRHYLQQGRDALVRTLDGLSEHDVRRPLTPSGTNLLGLVKHVTGGELGYLVESVGRPALTLPWNEDGSVWQGADMWVRAGEPREWIMGLYRQAWTLSDATLAEVPLDAPATVAWWPEERRVTTLGHLVVRVVAETAQHAGHAEILREQLDGQGGRDSGEVGDDGYWTEHVSGIQRAADEHR